MSNVLNSYFVNIGKRISESMNARAYDHYQYLKINYVNSLLFAPVSSADVEEIILSLRNKPGNINTISISVLKRTWRHVSDVLSYYQFVITNWYFSQLFKICQSDSHTKRLYRLQLMLATTDQYRYYRSLVIYLEKLNINCYTHILNKIIYFMSINMVSENLCLLCKHY